MGDFVIVVNAEKIAVTGKKREEKLYYRHSGYPGGLRTRTLDEMLERRPEEVIRKAVKGMLPRNRLARQQLRKLKVYAGPDHPHAAQKPEPMEIESLIDDEKRAGRRRGDAGAGGDAAGGRSPRQEEPAARRSAQDARPRRPRRRPRRSPPLRSAAAAR